MQNIAEQWRYRCLTLMGKILVVNTLMASLFVYKMYTCPLLSTQQLTQINQIITNFLWGGAKSKIPLTVLHLPKNRGGLGLVNFEAKHNALLIQWVKTVSENKHFQSYIYDWLVPDLKHLIWECNLNYTDVADVVKKESFWSEVLRRWATVNYKEPTSRQQILNQIIWCNTLIRVGDTPMRPVRVMLSSGITRILHIVQNGRLMTFDECCEKYGQIPWLTYGQIVHAIPKCWKQTLAEDIDNVSDDNISSSANSSVISILDFSREEDNINYFQLLNQKKTCKYVYDHLVRNNSKGNSFLEKYYGKWLTNYQYTGTFCDYVNLFRKLYKNYKCYNA